MRKLRSEFLGHSRSDTSTLHTDILVRDGSNDDDDEEEDRKKDDADEEDEDEDEGYSE